MCIEILDPMASAYYYKMTRYPRGHSTCKDFRNPVQAYAGTYVYHAWAVLSEGIPTSHAQ